METLRKGDKGKLLLYKYFKCPKCGWIGKADKTEYKGVTQYNETHYTVQCSCCKNTAFEIPSDDSELVEILRQRAL